MQLSRPLHILAGLAILPVVWAQSDTYLDAWAGVCTGVLGNGVHLDGNTAGLDSGDGVQLEDIGQTFCWKNNPDPSKQAARSVSLYGRPLPRDRNYFFFGGDCWNPNDYSGYLSTWFDANDIPETNCLNFNNTPATSVVVLPTNITLANQPNFRNNTRRSLKGRFPGDKLSQ